MLAAAMTGNAFVVCEGKYNARKSPGIPGLVNF
jgi:hypothetical protein